MYIFRRVILYLFLIITTPRIFSQTIPVFNWAKILPAETVYQNADGSMIVAGQFDASVNLVPGNPKYELKNTAWIRDETGANYRPAAVYVAKFDSLGQIIYATMFSGMNASVYKLKQTTNGHVVVVGTYNVSADFDPGPAVLKLARPENSYNASTFFLELDAKGNFVTARTLVHEPPAAVDVDGAGNIYLSVQAAKAIEFFGDKSTYQVKGGKNRVTYFGKFDNRGNRIFLQEWPGDVIINDIIIDTEGFVIIAGRQQSSFNADISGGKMLLKQHKREKSDGIHGNTNAFIAKYQPAGNLVFAYNLPASSVDKKSIGCDTRGNLYLTVNFSRTVDVDPSDAVFMYPTDNPIPMWTNYMLKMDKNGKFKYAMSLVGNSHLLTGDENENLYVLGSFSEEIDLDPGPAKKILSSEGGGFYIARYDPAGKYISGDQIRSEKTYSRSSLIRGSSLKNLQVDNAGNVLMNTGYWLTNYKPSSAVIEEKQLLSRTDLSRFSHTLTADLHKTVVTILKKGNSSRQQMTEGKHFKNTLLPSSNVFSLGVFPSDSLYNGIALLAFTDKKTSEWKGYYYGSMKDGLADGYGIFSTDSSYKEGFWKNGQLIKTKQGIEIFESVTAVLDYPKMFGYGSVTDIRTKITQIIFPRDMFNRKLENGYFIVGSILFKANSREHEVSLMVSKPDFYRAQQVVVLNSDYETSERFKKNNPNGYWDEITKLWLKMGEGYGDPKGGTTDDLKERNQQDLAGFINGKKDAPPAGSTGDMDYKSAYDSILARCAATDKAQFDQTDSLAGIWLDRTENKIIYIPSKGLGILTFVPLGNSDLFNGENYSMSKGGYTLTGGLTNKGWEIYGVEKDGSGGYFKFESIAVVSRLTRKSITFTTGRTWERLNP